MSIETGPRRQEPRRALVLSRSERRMLKKRRRRPVVREATDWLSPETTRAERVPRRPVKPGARGWDLRGGGQQQLLDVAPEFRATSVQVCGLYPFAVGSGSPLVGAPLGKSLTDGSTVCCDPIAWFLAQLVGQPSAFVLAKPGKGKSSLVRRMLTGMIHAGIVPLCMADVKPDYVDLITAVGGKVITLARGGGALNIFDPGPVLDMIGQLPPEGQVKVWAEIHGRQVAAGVGLLAMVRRTALSTREETILSTALRILRERGTEVPVVGDVLAIMREAHPELRIAAMDRGDMSRYQAATEGLEEGLMALGPDGPFGDIFCRPTTAALELGRPTVFDLSAIPMEDTELRAAVMASCWSYGSTMVSASQTAREYGVGDDTTYFLVLDELWQILRGWSGMIDLVDAITRLNRARNVGQVMITHTMDDLVMDTKKDTDRARGFVARSAIVFMGGLARKEQGNLAEVFAMSEREVELLEAWAQEARPDPNTGQQGSTPGRGCFLMKTGKAPGTPFRVELTPIEVPVNDTNQRWQGRFTS